VYPALLPLMRTPRLPVVDRTDAPADLNGLVRFAERRNLVSARVPSHFKPSLEPDKSQVTIFYGERVLHARKPRPQTHTFRICTTYRFSTASMITRTGLNVTFMRTLAVLVAVRPGVHILTTRLLKIVIYNLKL
jgi:hypothetical protein